MAMISAFTVKSVNENAQDTEDAEVCRNGFGAIDGPADRSELTAISRQLRHERRPLDTPRKMMYRAGRSQHRGPAGCEGQTNQSRAGNFDGSFGVGRDFDDAALPRKRRRHVKIALDIKRQSLRTS